MKILRYKVLVIDSLQETQKLLSEILESKGYFVKIVNNSDDGVQQALEHNYNLILCRNNLEKTSGFHVYKKLKDYLVKSGAAFFLLLNEFENEDVLLGLEMGIDNFILSPLNKDSLLRKIENQNRKLRELNIFESNKFKDYFLNSPVAMFIAENHQIIEANKAYLKLFKLSDIEEKQLMFHDIFELNGNPRDRMEFRKLENGLTDYCFLEKVKHIGNPNVFYSISKYSFSYLENGKTFAEIVPFQQDKKEGAVQDHSCPLYGTCLKIVNNFAEQSTTGVSLTKRENEIYELSAKGLPIKQIASKLHLSERTVEKHRSNIMGKTGSQNIIEAILFIQKEKLLNHQSIIETV